MSLDNPLLNDFIAALEQLSNPEMIFKVCFVQTPFVYYFCMLYLFFCFLLPCFYFTSALYTKATVLKWIATLHPNCVRRLKPVKTQRRA